MFRVAVFTGGVNMKSFGSYRCEVSSAMGCLAYGSTPLYARTLRVKCLPIFPNQSENRRRRENKITQKSIPNHLSPSVPLSVLYIYIQTTSQTKKEQEKEY